MCPHHIQLLKDAKPISSPPCRLNPKRKSLVRKELEEMLQIGIIEKIKAEDRDAKGWASPIVLVPKPDSSTHFGIIARNLNYHRPSENTPQRTTLEFSGWRYNL